MVTVLTFSSFLFLSLLQGKIIKGVYRFHAVITTFEMILADCPELRSIPWRCVVIDEAHRLKNRNCKLLEGLKMMDMVSGRCMWFLFFFDSQDQRTNVTFFSRLKLCQHFLLAFFRNSKSFFTISLGAQSSVDRNSSPEYCGGALQLTELSGAGEIPI